MKKIANAPFLSLARPHLSLPKGSSAVEQPVIIPWLNIPILCKDMGQAFPLEDPRLKFLITLCKAMLRYFNDWMSYSLIVPLEPVILFMGLFICYFVIFQIKNINFSIE